MLLSPEHLDAKRAGDLSTLFDVGGIFGEFQCCFTLDHTSSGKALVYTAYIFYSSYALFLLKKSSSKGTELKVVLKSENLVNAFTASDADQYRLE